MTSLSPVLKAAWDYYYAKTDEIRRMVEATPRFQNRRDHRAQAYQSLLEAQAMAYNQVVAVRQNHPRFYTYTYYNTNIYSLGQPSGDGLYASALLNGKQTYRVWGRLGDVRLPLFQILEPMMGHPNHRTTENHNLKNLAKPDGSFEFLLSAREQSGNWIPLVPDSSYNFVILRRWFGDWYDDMGEIHIEMLDEPIDYDPFSEEAMAERIRVAADYMVYLTQAWTIDIYDIYIRVAGGEKNKFGLMTGESVADTLVGSPLTSYVDAVVDLEEGEALILEGEVPVSDYWSYQLGDVWCRSLDYANYQTDLNIEKVKVNADGKYRVVVSHRDPGVHNWLDPQNHTEFHIVMRNYNERGEKRIGIPTIQRIKFSELTEHLPDDMVQTSPKQRKQDLEYRRRGFERLFEYNG